MLLRAVVLATLALIGAAQAQINGGGGSLLSNPLSPSTGVSSRPSPLGNWNSVGTACTGNLSGTVLASCFSITGSTTLSQPTTGYVYTDEAYPYPTFTFNSSGFNNGTADNTGRTAALAYHSYFTQAGQGDGGNFACDDIVTSAKASATNFLANPAIQCFSGQLIIGSEGGYAEGLGDLAITDAVANTITVTIASPGVVTSTLTNISTTYPQTVVFSTTGALPTGITAGTVYWTIPSSFSAGSFQIASSYANALVPTPINTTGTQSGVHTAKVGYDGSGIGAVFNLTRTNAVGALNTNWGGPNVQNKGSLPFDWVTRGIGAARIGADYSALTYPDLTLVGISVNTGGSGCSANDILTPTTGTFDQPLTVKVLTVDGGGAVLTFGVDRDGLYSTAPASTATMSGGTCSVAPTFTVQYSTTTTNPAIVLGAGEVIYGNAAQDTGVYNTKYPSTLKLGTSYFGYQSGLGGWNVVVGNNSVAQFTNDRLNVVQTLRLNGNLVMSPTAPTIVGGSGCTTGSAQSISSNNGTAAFAITLGGATCGSTITLTLPAAPTFWVCNAHDLTNPASNIVEQSGNRASTTSVVLTNYVRTTGVAGNFTGGDVVGVSCTAQ